MSEGPVLPPGLDRYLDIDLPERFELQILGDDGNWWTEAVLLRRDFARTDDGSYGRVAYDMSPVIFRSILDLGDSFVHMDGGGRVFRYRLLALDPERKAMTEIPPSGLKDSL